MGLDIPWIWIDTLAVLIFFVWLYSSGIIGNKKRKKGTHRASGVNVKVSGHGFKEISVDHAERDDVDKMINVYLIGLKSPLVIPLEHARNVVAQLDPAAVFGGDVKAFNLRIPFDVYGTYYEGEDPHKSEMKELDYLRNSNENLTGEIIRLSNELTDARQTGDVSIERSVSTIKKVSESTMSQEMKEMMRLAGKK